MATERLILIGMPGAGKSTVGRALAKRLQWDFIDTDEWIETRFGQTLAELVSQRGLEGFRGIEEQALMELRPPPRAVIATGGSVIYSERAMRALGRLGPMVFLDCPLDIIAGRVGDPAARGMLIAPGQSLTELYRQRIPLYRRHAGLTVACDNDPPALVVERILGSLACSSADGDPGDA